MVKKVLFLCALTITISAFAMEGKGEIDQSDHENKKSRIMHFISKTIPEDEWNKLKKEKEGFRTDVNIHKDYKEYNEHHVRAYNKWFDEHKDVLAENFGPLDSYDEWMRLKNRGGSEVYIEGVDDYPTYDAYCKDYEEKIDLFIDQHNAALPLPRIIAGIPMEG